MAGHPDSFDRVLVPLDGSEMAEAGLDPARALAAQMGSRLVLVHALEDDPPAEVHGEPHLTDATGAQAYLDKTASRLRDQGLEVETHVEASPDADVATALVDLAARFQTGLVAMCAHGRRSLRGRLLGPIAQRALRADGPPILLTTAGSAAREPMALRHILFPVDFRHDLERATADVEALGRGCGASLTLLHAVDAGATGLPARMLPNTTLELSQRRREAAQERLAALAERLERQGIDTDVVVSTDEPEDAIVECARDRGSDLIVLVSHGRGGISAWYEHSVGRTLIAEAGLTLLLLAPAADDSNEE